MIAVDLTTQLSILVWFVQSNNRLAESFFSFFRWQVFGQVGIHLAFVLYATEIMCFALIFAPFLQSKGH